jgi:hypothetical protein
MVHILYIYPCPERMGWPEKMSIFDSSAIMLSYLDTSLVRFYVIWKLFATHPFTLNAVDMWLF